MVEDIAQCFEKMLDHHGIDALLGPAETKANATLSTLAGSCRLPIVRSFEAVTFG